MNVELFIAFCLAVTVLVLMPGPIVTLVIANSLSHGTRSGLITVAGSSTGNALLIAAGALGLTTLMVLLSDLFEILRWAGAAYLIWLGILAWRRSPQGTALRSPPVRAPGALFAQGAVIAITNPKTILFYIAFFPQFLDPALPAGPQLVVMSISMLTIATTCDSLYALLAGRLRGWFTDPKRQRLQARITGTLLITTGLGLLFARRNG